MIPLNLALAVALAAADVPATSATAEDWAPLNAYVGVWNGTRATPDGMVAVIRKFEAAADNQQLQVTEQIGRNRSLWGVVSFDAARRGLVLRRSGAGGTAAADLFLSAVSDDQATLVFATEPAGDAPPVERITLERHGWNEFIERVQAAADGKELTVSETRFRRKQ